MLNFLETDPDFEVKKILSKNAVTAVTLLPPLSSKGYSEKSDLLPSVTFVTDFVTSVTAVTEKDTQKQCGNKVTKVTAKKTNINFIPEDHQTDREEKRENLQNSGANFTPEDWKIYFDERAAVYEFEANFCPKRAALEAYNDCMIRWLKVKKYSISDTSALGQSIEFLTRCGIPDPLDERTKRGFLTR